MKTSFPKSKINVLLLENIHEDAKRFFSDESFNVELISESLPVEELVSRVQDKHILGVRSKTQVPAEVFQKANKLWAVGVYCIGTNHLDLATGMDQGVAIFNAPFSNTRSVVELVIAEIISLYRQMTDRSQNMHSGIWEKSAAGCHEIRGKKLGIVGYGNIGAQLSVLAEALGMKVYYYDIVEKLALGNAIKCRSLNELLQEADIVSLHVDGRKENINMMSEKEFKHMQKGSLFLNLSRGSVVDIDALHQYLKNGHLAGAAVDVFPEEPHANGPGFQSKLQGLKNVILSPHVGGSTLEAQVSISHFVTNNIIDYINRGDTTMSVNFPQIKLPELVSAHRMIHVHQNVPGVLAYINKLFANHGINILGQYLKTNERIGYVITDVGAEYDSGIIKDLKEYEHTIRFRVLY